MDKQAKDRIMQLYQSGYDIQAISKIVGITPGRIWKFLGGAEKGIPALKRTTKPPAPAFSNREISVYQKLVTGHPERLTYLPTQKKGWNVENICLVMEAEGLPVSSDKSVLKLLKKFSLLMPDPWKNELRQDAADSDILLNYSEFTANPAIPFNFPPGIHYFFYSYDKNGYYNFMVYLECLRYNYDRYISDIPRQIMEEDFEKRVRVNQEQKLTWI